jgi:hypothetical protein
MLKNEKQLKILFYQVAKLIPLTFILELVTVKKKKLISSTYTIIRANSYHNYNGTVFNALLRTSRSTNSLPRVQLLYLSTSQHIVVKTLKED